MFEKRNPIACRRNSRIRDPSRSFVQDFANRIVEPIRSLRERDRGEAAAVRTPVRTMHVLQNLARRAAGQRNLRERTDAFAPVQPTTERNGDLTGGRDGK